MFNITSKYFDIVNYTPHGSSAAYKKEFSYVLFLFVS